MRHSRAACARPQAPSSELTRVPVRSRVCLICLLCLLVQGAVGCVCCCALCVRVHVPVCGCAWRLCGRMGAAGMQHAPCVRASRTARWPACAAPGHTHTSASCVRASPHAAMQTRTNTTHSRMPVRATALACTLHSSRNPDHAATPPRQGQAASRHPRVLHRRQRAAEARAEGHQPGRRAAAGASAGVVMLRARCGTLCCHARCAVSPSYASCCKHARAPQQATACAPRARPSPVHRC
jgi:hypothetical protein